MHTCINIILLFYCYSIVVFVTIIQLTIIESNTNLKKNMNIFIKYLLTVLAAKHINK